MTLAEEVRALRRRNTKLKMALSAFIHRLDVIHEDPAYKSVWTINQIHAGPYTGPTYAAELAEAREALKEEGDAG